MQSRAPPAEIRDLPGWSPVRLPCPNTEDKQARGAESHQTCWPLRFPLAILLSTQTHFLVWSEEGAIILGK